MRSIELKTGVWTTLDDEDYDRLKDYKWLLSKSGYAYRRERRDGKTVQVWMHREVVAEELAWRKGRWQVHHFDENKLNNQRRNLLVCEPRWHSHQHGGGYLARKFAFKTCGTLQSKQRRTF